MKATYFFSKKQLEVMQRIAANNGKTYRPNFVNGKQFTEVITTQGEHRSNFDDAKIVAIRENLPVDKFMLEQTGTLHAKI